MPGKGKQPTVKRAKRTMREPTPKPCPTCYSPMKPIGKDLFECAKHGAPTKR